MKRKALVPILSLILIWGCNTQTNNDSNNENYSQDNNLKFEILKDSMRLVEQQKLEKEIKELENMGALGKWRCDFSGYESEIILFKDKGLFFSLIVFTKDKLNPKVERLQKQGDKFFVINSKAKEYYKIKDDGNLELGDKEGFFTNALNITPNSETKVLPPLDISTTIGKDIFYITGNYSKSFAKTLDGTNAKIWVVYYEDINVIFTVDKSNNKILSAKENVN